jgi:hypothetical protein
VSVPRRPLSQPAAVRPTGCRQFTASCWRLYFFSAAELSAILKALPSIAIDNFLIGFLINLRAARNLFSFLALLAFSLSRARSQPPPRAADGSPCCSERARHQSSRFRKDALFARRQNVNTLFFGAGRAHLMSHSVYL